ncbi:MAG TPA: VWA domain-containing protein [Halioglobus sp.]
MELHLLRPQWLWTLVPALVLILLLWRQRGRSGSWQTVIAPELLRYLVSDHGTSKGRNFLPMVFLGWLLAALAASGPSWQKIPQPVQQKQDALVMILDLSYSMKSADLAPSRLERARQKLLDLLQQRREGQTALIAYAGDAHIVTPLTDDTLTIANLLPALNPDMMPLPGSKATHAVSLALELLRSAGMRQGNILLVTDGVADKERETIEKALAGSNAKLSIMGVGTATGAPIPLPNGGFLKDGQGTIVMPVLDEAGLRALSNATGGSYSRMQLDDSDLANLLAVTHLGKNEETIALERTADTWEDQGYLFILALLPLALGLFRRGWLMALLPVMLLVHPHPASATIWDDLWLTPDQQGQRALQQGDSKAAANLFENPQWAGTAAYQSGDYTTAAERFTDPDNADSLYNRGNALAKAGQLDEAIDAYEGSLKLRPDQNDARDNLDLLKKLKEQQDQQNQNQQQNQNEDQNQNQSQNQDQKQEQNQDQDQNQDQQQNQDKNQDSRNSASRAGEQSEPPEKQPNSQQQQQPEPEPDSGSKEQQTADNRLDQQDQGAQPASGSEPSKEEPGSEQGRQTARTEAGEEERDQAMEQWLRRVPDDPSGLLREKFRYESLQREEHGGGNNDENIW